MGTQLPHGKGTAAPIFGPCLIVAKRLDGSIKMPSGTEVGLDTGDIVLDGDPAPPTERGTVVPLLSRFTSLRPYKPRPMSKRLDTSGFRMPLGTEVCLGPGDFVFDGDPATP